MAAQASAPIEPLLLSAGEANETEPPVIGVEVRFPHSAMTAAICIAAAGTEHWNSSFTPERLVKYNSPYNTTGN
jgi:hypothetical protein